jgi:hypothetical protein
MVHAYMRHPMVYAFHYLATEAFFVLGALVFCVRCQHCVRRGGGDRCGGLGWGKHTVADFLGRAALTLASPFLTAALTYATWSA